MRINPPFTSFFTHRLVLGSEIVMLVLFFITPSFAKPSDRDLRVKQTNITIRMIGHRLLLLAGDSTSRVMPVTEIREGTFLLKFENEFVFNHDSLIALTQRLLPKAQFPSGYTVTVHDCTDASIVYGFQINKASPNYLACRGRSQSSGCYTIEIAFPDFYENTDQKKADIGLPTEKLKSLKNDPLTEEVKAQEAKSVPPVPMAIGIKTSTFNPFINVIYIGMLVLLGVALLITRFGKSLVPVPVQHQNHAIIKEFVPELPALGKFLFDVKDQRLLSGSEVITLTDKECRILELLNKSFGELIPRETLMQEIWINEGVITGRSLDMFVSKLRKKLSSDPELRITNVHGKGYKLEK